MSHFIDHISVSDHGLFVKSGTARQILILCLSSSLEEYCAILSTQGSLPKFCVLRGNQIDFIEDEKHFLATSDSLLLDLSIAAAFWVSGVQHFNDNIRVLNDFLQLSVVSFSALVHSS